MAQSCRNTGGEGKTGSGGVFSAPRVDSRINDTSDDCIGSGGDGKPSLDDSHLLSLVGVLLLVRRLEILLVRVLVVGGLFAGSTAGSSLGM